MKKLKDFLGLLFWGILAGVFFVGCILGFMALWNWAVPVLAHYPKWLLNTLALGLLAAVITGIAGLIFKIALPINNKICWKQAEKIFSPELCRAIKAAPIACAVVEQREDIIEQLRFIPKSARNKIINTPILKTGATALHIAAALDRKKFCKYLIKYGANIFCKDKQGQHPLAWAQKYNGAETAHYLSGLMNK